MERAPDPAGRGPGFRGRLRRFRPKIVSVRCPARPAPSAAPSSPRPRPPPPSALPRRARAAHRRLEARDRRRCSTAAAGTRARPRCGGSGGSSRAGPPSRPRASPSPVRLGRPGLHRFPMLVPRGRGRAAARSASRSGRPSGATCSTAGSCSSTPPTARRAAASTRRSGASSRRCSPPRRSRRSPRDHVLNKSFYLLDRQGGPRPREAVARGAGARRPPRGRLLAERPRRRLGARASSATGSTRARRAARRSARRAFRLGVNLAMYALCTDYKDDAVHLPFILRRRTS